MVPKLWLIFMLVTTQHLAFFSFFSFFSGLRYLRSNIFLLHNKSKFPLLPPERIIPTIGIVAISHGCSRDLHHFHSETCCCWQGPCTALADCCIGRETAPEALTTCFVLAYTRDHLKFLVCELISFILNIRKSSTS